MTFLTTIRQWIKDEEEEEEDAPASTPREKNEKGTPARIEMIGCGVLAGTDYAEMSFREEGCKVQWEHNGEKWTDLSFFVHIF